MLRIGNLTISRTSFALKLNEAGSATANVETNRHSRSGSNIAFLKIKPSDKPTIAANFSVNSAIMLSSGISLWAAIILSNATVALVMCLQSYFFF